jgi:hypothetical protein
MQRFIVIKYLLFAFLATVLNIRSAAQPLQGNYTIGGNSADFSSFTLAANALNTKGVGGPVIFNVRPGTYSEQIILNTVSGSSCINTITFQSENNDSASVVLNGTGFSNPAIRIFQTDGIKIKHLTVKSSYFKVIEIGDGAFGNGSDCNEISNTHIIGIGSTTLVNIWSVSEDRNNIIKNNILDNGAVGISNDGPRINLHKRTVIENNVFINQSQVSLSLDLQDSAQIVNNRINSQLGNGISLNACQRFKILNNKVQAAGTGILLQSSGGVGSLIANNFIAGTSGKAVDSYAGGGETQIYYNNIRSSGSVASLSFLGGTFDLRNNNIVNLGGGAAFDIQTAISYCDYNNFFSTGPVLGKWFNSTVTDLENLKTNSGKNSHSISVDPLFTSPVDLHVNQAALNGKAISVPQVTGDIDGELRDPLTPDIGADEVNAVFRATEVVSPNTACGLTANEIIAVKVSNFSKVSVSGFDISYQLNNGAVVKENVGSLVLLPDSSVQYSFLTRADLSVFTSNTIKAFTSSASDPLAKKDTVTKSVQNIQPVFAPGNLLPVNGAVNLDKPINFSWSAVPTSTAYDLYIWSAFGDMPVTPVAANLTQLNYSYSAVSLSYGMSYKWKVVARNNNCQASSVIHTFTLRDLPDLIVEEINAPSGATSESDISVDWRIKNIGKGTTGSTGWYESVYLSESLLKPMDGLQLGSFSSLSALEPGQSYSYLPQSFRIPVGYQGQYYVVVVTSPSYAIKESVDTNNILIKPITITLAPPPDLQVPAVIPSPTTIFSGDSLRVSYTVKNSGTGPTSASSWYDIIYLSKDEVLDKSNATILESFRRNGALIADEAYSRTIKYKLPVNAEGDYYIHVVTDATLEVFEYVKENNNTGSSDIIHVILRPTPNLIVMPVDITYDTVSNNQLLKIDWITKNDGAASGKPFWRDNIRLLTDTVYNPSTGFDLGDYWHRDTLQSFSATGVQMNVYVPGSVPEGKYHFFVKTDYYDNVFEAHDEDDNVSKAGTPLYILNPDLKPVSLTASQTKQNATISWTIANAAKGGIYGSSWTDVLYLSADTVLSPGTDQLLSSVLNESNLKGGIEYSNERTVVLPNGIQGNYYFILYTDYGNKVYEKENNNNQKLYLLNISITPSPDLVITNVDAAPTGIAGTTLNFSCAVKNAGSSKIDNKVWRDMFYLSPTTNVNDAGRIYLKEQVHQRTLDTGQLYSLTLSATINSKIQGKFYLVAITDDGNSISEGGGENNNYRVSDSILISAYPHFDLSAMSGRLHATALTAGESVSAEWVVKNTGGLATIAPIWEDAIYISTDTALDAGDLSLGVKGVNTVISPQGNYKQSLTFKIPDNAVGKVYLLLNADKTNQHNDTVRKNNVLILENEDGRKDGIIITRHESDLVPVSLVPLTEGTAGQPLMVSYTVRNEGSGTTNKSDWMDQVYISSDNAWDINDKLIATFSHQGNLPAGAQYYGTEQVFLPASSSGNYYVIFKVDAANNVYEYNAEQNNLSFASLFIRDQQPSDLIVTHVTPPADAWIAGELLQITWALKNIGKNGFHGYFRDAVYLSEDATWDMSDILFGTADTTVNNLTPGSILLRQSTKPISNVAPGHYYIIVRTDILNNLIESDEVNNTGISQDRINVDVKVLTMAETKTDSLVSGQYLYYRINISSAQQGETMLLTLRGDTLEHAVNKIFLAYNKIPKASEYDFVAQASFTANQQIVVPALKEGSYYLLVQGNHPEKKIQAVRLRADIIPFAITGVHSDKGGNTGAVTIKINGARFESNTSFKLQSNTLGVIMPMKVYYIDGTQVYATFNITNQKTGFYNVVATQFNDDSTRFVNGFEVVQGPGSSSGLDGPGGGGGTGFVCKVVNIGFEDELGIDLAYPAFTLEDRLVTITIYYENKGTVDIPTPTRYFVSLSKNVPVALTLDELRRYRYESSPEFKTNLILDFKDDGGPPGILRPGANGYFKIYTIASYSNLKAHEFMNFIIEE